MPRLDLLLSKRIFGLLSWHFRRKAIHEGPVLPALVEDLHGARPDHTVVTGDLVNISLPDEFIRAAAWLRDLGPPSDVSVIPGNHDAYVPLAWQRSLALWSDYMAGEGLDQSRLVLSRNRGARARNAVIQARAARRGLSPGSGTPAG